MTTLTDLELFQYDTTGILRLPGFLTSDEVSELRSALEEMPAAECEFEATERRERLEQHSSAFAELTTDPRLTRRVFDLINQPMRLIETYALLRGPGSFLPLHNGLSEQLDLGGQTPVTVSRNLSQFHTFHNGKLYCMYVKVLVYLTDIETDEDGPFCFVQGSHKANFPLLRTLYQDRDGVPIASESPISTLEKLYPKAGDVVLLNESLMHGTLAKTSSQPRVNAAFSYTPSFVSDWSPLDVADRAITRIGHYETEVEEDFLGSEVELLSGVPD